MERHGVGRGSVLLRSSERRDHAVGLRRAGEVDRRLREVQLGLGQPHVLDGLRSRHRVALLHYSPIAGTVQGVTAWLLGSSYALGLAVIAGLLDMIPNIGAILAGFILVPVLWAEEGITAAIIMLVVLLVYQQIENNVVTPKVQGVAVNLSAFFIIVAVTLFGALLGVLGALTAVPLAAVIQIFVQELTKARREKVAAAHAALEATAKPA